MVKRDRFKICSRRGLPVRIRPYAYAWMAELDKVGYMVSSIYCRKAFAGSIPAPCIGWLNMKDDLFSDVSWFKPYIDCMSKVWEYVQSEEDDRMYQITR